MTAKDQEGLSQKSQTSTSRELKSCLEGFLEYLKHAPAPAIYKKWAGISLIAAAMTRRVWVHTDLGMIFPNMMNLTVGGPSAGKGPALTPVEQFLRRLDTGKDILRMNEGIHLGPGDATVAGLFDEFVDEKSQRTFIYNGKTTAFNTVVIVAEELAAFMHNVEHQMMGYLIKWLNCMPHSQRLRSKGETLSVERPVLNIIGGVQPKVLSHIFPSSAFGMGLTARTIFVYSDEKVRVAPFASRKIDHTLEDKIVHDLRRITKLTGPFSFTDEAAEFIDNWWEHKAIHDEPKHPKLEGYCGKRILHLFRVCMVLSASRSDSMVIDINDVLEALELLLEVEKEMPKIFEAMSGEHANEDVFADIAHQIASEYQRTGEPLMHHTVTRMIAKKVKSYEIVSVLQSLLDQEMIKEVQTRKLKVPGAGAKAYIPGDEYLRRLP